MTQRTITCPYCASQITGESTVCLGCQEDLAALAHLVYADAIHYNQALAWAKEGRLREAKAELAESLAANSAFGPAYALLAKIFARELDWTNALLNAKKALSLLPEDEAIVHLADAVIDAAPPVDQATYVDPTRIPANPTVLNQSHSEAAELTSSTDTTIGSAAGNPPQDNQVGDTATDVTQPAQVVAPVQSRVGAAERRASSNRRHEPPGRSPNTAGPTVGPSSYLFPPQEIVPHVVNPPVAPLVEPIEEPLAEPNAEPTNNGLPVEGSYGPLFKGSIWRTLGMGILITAGLAILIRAIGGED